MDMNQFPSLVLIDNNRKNVFQIYSFQRNNQNKYT